MLFSDLNLDQAIVKAVSHAGYCAPTPIQQQAIPVVLSGRDLMAAAQTGTGKTASFVLPILQKFSQRSKVHPRPVKALILSPTRELAAQIDEQVAKYSQYLEPKIKHLVVFGGVSINPQMMALRGGVDILTATPGRLLDLVGQNAVKLNEVDVLVLDEADRMLDMGFIHDIKKILALLPKERQNLLFSATFSNDIKGLTANILRNPLSVSVTPENTTAEKIEQKVYQVPKGQKTATLIELVQSEKWQQVLVFMATKHEANRLSEKLNQAGINAAAIHGNKSQNARTAALSGFKNNEIQVLVASDVAARGIDIAQLPYVVNFTLPRSPADYVHRIGRTGRAGKTGLAVSFVSPDELPQLKLVEKLIGMKIPQAAVPNTLNIHVNDKELTTRPPRPPRPAGSGARSSNPKNQSGAKLSNPNAARGRSQSRDPHQKNDPQQKSRQHIDAQRKDPQRKDRPNKDRPMRGSQGKPTHNDKAASPLRRPTE